MSWSLEIAGGDLNLLSSSSGMGIVTGKSKTFQDLKHALLEAMGTDPMHPEYGSLLDGGRLPDGTIVQSFVGSESLSTSRVEEEVLRVVKAFIKNQQDRINLDISSLGKTTISDAEIIDSVSGIESTVFDTKMVVKLSLRMRDGNGVTITQPLG